jgi:hypothetical protein
VSDLFCDTSAVLTLPFQPVHDLMLEPLFTRVFLSDIEPLNPHPEHVSLLLDYFAFRCCSYGRIDISLPLSTSPVPFLVGLQYLTTRILTGVALENMYYHRWHRTHLAIETNASTMTDCWPWFMVTL